nr:efflux pump ustt [Quercus suber]
MDSQSNPKIAREPIITEQTPLFHQERSAVEQGVVHSSKFVVWVVMVILVLLSFAEEISQPPQTRIMESVICYRYYETADPSKIQIGRDQIGPGALGGVPEMLCKVGAVQGELAELGGYQRVFDGLPALLLAVPFGWAADKYGRKPVFALSVLSLTLAALWINTVLWFFQLFAIRLTWLSTLSSLLGGGNPVFTGLFYVILSDVTTSTKRTALFLRALAVNIMAGLVMPPIAAWLMIYNSWIPILFGTVLNFGSLALVIFLPETLDFKQSSLEYEGDSFGPATEVQPVPPETMPGSIPASSYASRVVLLARQSTSFLTEDWRISVCIIPFVSHFLVAQTGRLMLQYYSSRYDLTFSQATLLLTIFSGFKVLLLSFILPHGSVAIMKYFRLSDQQKDLYLARVSQIFVVVGWTSIGLAPNVPIVVGAMIVASLGHGALTLLRSFITTLVPAHHIARMYSVITIVDTLGSMFGSALLADLFQQGLTLGGVWIGAPFLFMGLVSLLFLVLMVIVRLRKDEVEELVEEEGDEAE